MRFGHHCMEHAGSLNYVNCAAREPWSAELIEERLFDDQRTNAGRESEHLVETDCHCVYGVIT